LSLVFDIFFLIILVEVKEEYYRFCLDKLCLYRTPFVYFAKRSLLQMEPAKMDLAYLLPISQVLVALVILKFFEFFIVYLDEMR
jgi:hypothetical protein